MNLADIAARPRLQAAGRGRDAPRNLFTLLLPGILLAAVRSESFAQNIGVGA